MFEQLPQLPLDPIFQLMADFHTDPRQHKINLGIGVYNTSQGLPFVFPSVQRAFAKVDASNFNYQPIRGNPDFLLSVFECLLPEEDEQQWALQATCGGTQACRIIADISAQLDPAPEILIAVPTWGNHLNLFQQLQIQTLNHLNTERKLNLEGYKNAILNAKEGSILLLHGGQMHNPTGLGFTTADLDEIIPLVQKKRMMVFIDMAYAGFGDGFEEDITFIKKCAQEMGNLAVGFSFSKSASLYEHRTGILMIKGPNKEVIESQLSQCMRESVSMAPGVGQEVIQNLLSDHKEKWFNDLETARKDLLSRKKRLLERLPNHYQDIADTKGFFATIPLKPDHIQQLQKEFAIYMPSNGRINFGSLQEDQITATAEALSSVF